MDKSRECLYDVKWQVLRMRLHEKWTSQNGAHEALLELLDYIGKAKTPYWKVVRMWRVMNLLNVTRKQYAALNKTGFKEDIQVRKALQGLNIEFNRIVSSRNWNSKAPRAIRGSGTTIYPGPFKKWNWDQVKLDLEALFRDKPKTFQKLLTVSENRLIDVNRRKVALDIPELTRFVALMRDATFEVSDASG